MPRARRIRVYLKGPDAELGRVPAVDVGRLLIGVERAVAQAATVVTGGRVSAGRRKEAVESSTRFRLVGLERGSVVAELDLPKLGVDGQPAFRIDDRTLTDLAVEHTLRTLEGSEEDRQVARYVAVALEQLAEDLSIGSRYEALDIEAPRSIRPRRRRVRLNGAARTRLRVAAQVSPPRPGTVVGVLVEADFEKWTAHLRTATGLVFVSFPKELADHIKQGLRDQTQLEGLVTFDPKTSVATQVDLRAVLRGRQLSLGFDASRFWQSRNVNELADEQGVGPVIDASELRVEGVTDSEVDAFLAFLRD